MDCRLVRTHLDGHVDGELDPSALLELDAHLEACSECRDELSVHRALKRGVREADGGLRAPASLRRRIQRALDAEDASRPDVGRRDRIAFLAVAAGVLLALGGGLRSDTRGPRVEAGIADGGFDLLGDIVERHTNPLPADPGTEQPERARSFFRGKVGIDVDSVEFAAPEVKFLGGRVSHIGHARAAKLDYSVGGRRVTLVAFRPSPDDRARLISTGGPRVRVGDREVTYHTVHGYTVPVFEHAGVTYAFTGDLERERLLKLVASARLP
jgi:anti-sigma factor (TIGR02949 family)